jgi:hypothetical protein
MIVDIHKPDTSTLVTTGHFYFGWTTGGFRLDTRSLGALDFVGHGSNLLYRDE